ncbi:hypothetical protein BC827DRAFT_1274107 [Russula dissimulans]|nr:hypothetical protein BC827DRAFT_1274107 [Russula dissimulans]
MARANNRQSKTQPSRPPYSQEMFLSTLVWFIVADNQSINLVECPESRNLLLLLQEDLKEIDIPRRHKVHAVILQAWNVYFACLKDKLKQALGNISFTADPQGASKALHK